MSRGSKRIGFFHKTFHALYSHCNKRPWCSQTTHSSVKNKAWISDVATVVNTNGVITWGAFNSQFMDEECVKRRDQIDILPLFFE